MRFVARTGGKTHEVRVSIIHEDGDRIRLRCEGILPYPGYWKFEKIERGQTVQLIQPDGTTLRARFTGGSGRRMHVVLLPLETARVE